MATKHGFRRGFPARAALLRSLTALLGLAAFVLPGGPGAGEGVCAPAAGRAVTLYVIDDFSTLDSHGSNVHSMLERSSARRVPIRSIDTGRTLERELYFRSLREIAATLRADPASAAVINLSFGSYEGDPLEQALIDSVRAAGAIVVAAAGNDGTGRTFYPAGYPGVIAVGALDNDGRIASYSNFGPHVGLFAGGHFTDEIVSNRLVMHSAARYEHVMTYRFIGGTSFAAPQVAGLVAYLLAQRPDLGPADAVALVQRHARVLPVQPGRSPATVLDARAVLADADPLYRRMTAARRWLYGVVGLFFLASVLYARGPGLVLVLAVFLWGGLMGVLSRVIVTRFGIVNGGMLLHAVIAFGVLLLSTWNFVAAVNERRREREARETARRIAAALEAAVERSRPDGYPGTWPAPPPPGPGDGPGERLP